MRTGHRLADIGPLQIHNPAPAPPTFRSTCFHSSPQARSHSFQAPQPLPSLPGPIDPPPVAGPQTSLSDPKRNLPPTPWAPCTTHSHCVCTKPFSPRHSVQTNHRTFRPPIDGGDFPIPTVHHTRREPTNPTTDPHPTTRGPPHPAVLPPTRHDPSQPSRVAMSAGPCLARIWK